MRETWTFHSAGSLLFGPNACQQLGDVAGRLGARRFLLVTDPVILRTGVMERVRLPLNDSGVIVEVFSGGEPEPSVPAADACIECARGHEPPDCLGQFERGCRAEFNCRGGSIRRECRQQWHRRTTGRRDLRHR